MRRSRTSGTIYIDFAAAFPSVIHRWIWQAMYDMGLPTPVIVAMITLYSCTWAEIRFAGAAPARFRVISGIRQGCPASGSVFAIAIDSALHFLDRFRRCPQDIFIAYTDDLAFFWVQFLLTLPALLRGLVAVQHATGMALAARKTSTIPAWTTDLVQAQADVAVATPAAEHIQVVSHFRHVGVMVGPTSHHVLRDVATAKFRAGRRVSGKHVARPYVLCTCFQCPRLRCVL